MRAIVTKYHGPTNTKGSRISASDGSHKVFVPYPYGESGEDVHRVALAALLAKVEWFSKAEKNPDNWIGGWTDTGYVFVYVVI